MASDKFHLTRDRLNSLTALISHLEACAHCVDLRNSLNTTMGYNFRVHARATFLNSLDRSHPDFERTKDWIIPQGWFSWNNWTTARAIEPDHREALRYFACVVFEMVEQVLDELQVGAGEEVMGEDEEEVSMRARELFTEVRGGRAEYRGESWHKPASGRKVGRV